MNKAASGALAIIVLAAVLTLAFYLHRSVTVEAVYPIEKAKHSLVERGWIRFKGCFQGAAAAAENRLLKRRLAALTLVEADLARVETENARLRNALDYTAKNLGEWLPASVLSQGGGAAQVRRTLRVDKGSLAGVKVDAIVVVPEGLVGKVIAVTPHTAEVLLLADPALYVAAEVEAVGEERLKGIVSGGENGRLIINHTNRVVPPVRSRTITSGAGGLFPRGIEIGVYLAEGEILPSVDYTALEDVFIRREK